MRIHTVGIDIAKTVFHLVAVDEKGSVVVKKKFSRSQLLVFTANLKAEVIGMEACSRRTLPDPRPSCSGTQRKADAGGVCSTLRQVQQERLHRC
jgi:hypothetical protein